MLSNKSAENYILEDNKRLREENEKMKQNIADLEEELESCGNDEKTITNLRGLTTNLSAINKDSKEIINLFEKEKNLIVTYIKDSQLSYQLYQVSFVIFLCVIYFFNFSFVYVIIFQGLVEINIYQFSISELKKNTNKIYLKIHEKKKIYEKSYESLDILNNLIENI